MKFLKKHLFNLVSIILIICLSFYVIRFGIKNVIEYEIYKEPSIETRIYSVWHIETFEGGGKSRLQYVNNVAKQIEKCYPGILFVIKNVDPENLETLLSESTPDIVSFGFGVGKTILPYLCNLDKTFTVREELINSGSFNNCLYAIPYVMSGYALIFHSDTTNTLYCGENGFINPSIVYTGLNLQPQQKDSQYEAYKHFVNNKNSTLLGSARDVFRINNLNNLGRTNATISPIETYTDLIQYIALTRKDYICDLFIEKCLAKDNQISLVEYSLFSSTYNKLYSDGIYNTMENAIYKASIPNVFYA